MKGHHMNKPAAVQEQGYTGTRTLHCRFYRGRHMDGTCMMREELYGAVSLLVLGSCLVAYWQLEKKLDCDVIRSQTTFREIHLQV
jgi:hypothetical protein